MNRYRLQDFVGGVMRISNPCFYRQKYFFSGFSLSATIGPLRSIGLLLLLIAHPAFAGADLSRQFLDAWLAQQAQAKTWSADVVQIRKLKSLVRPLESRGRVWFRQPNRFRWQLGEPPRTIAVRTASISSSTSASNGVRQRSNVARTDSTRGGPSND